MLEKPIESETISPERIELFVMGLKTLTPTEKSIYEAYIARVTTKEIMANMNIKESTLKYHNRNLYSKLGVANRKELLESHKHIKYVKDLGYDELSSVTLINTPARIRMTTLYGISGTVGGRVANTCNLSEDWVGYSTKFGDAAGDFCALGKLTVGEVKAIGRETGIPIKFIDKVPIDGLCGSTDEDNLGFTYDVLDKYIRTGICEDQFVKEKIDRMHKANLHKLEKMPMFHYEVV